MIGLTKRQREVLDFIRHHVRDKGYAPSVGEIATYFAISSPSALMHLRALQKKKIIQRGDKARSIVLAENLPTMPATQTLNAASERIMTRCYETATDYLNKQSSQNVFISPEFVSSTTFRELFAIQVTHEFALPEFGILPNDILIVKQAALSDDHQLCVANLNGQFILGKTMRAGKNTILQQGSQKYKNLVIMGIVIGLQRAYEYTKN